MTSKISLFKLMREDLRHRSWMVIFSAIVQFIFGTVVFVFSLSTTGFRSGMGTSVSRIDERVEALLSQVSVYRNLMITIAAFSAVVAAIWGFKHLYSRKMEDLYESAPVKKNRRFLAIYLNGIAIWFSVLLVNTILVMLISLAYGCTAEGRATAIVELLLTLPVTLFVYLMVYNVTLVGVSYAGTAFNSLVNATILGFSAICNWGLAVSVMASSLDTFREPMLSMELLSAFSPIFGAIETAIIMNNPDEYNGVLFFLVSIVLLILNFFWARHAYCHRKAELAEGGVLCKWYRTILSVTCVLVGALLGAFIFGNIVGFIRTDFFLLFWMVVGALIGAFLASGIINVIFHHTLRSFFAHIVVHALTLVAAILFIAGCYFDVLGYDTYLPKERNIDGIRFACNDFKSTNNLVRKGDVATYQFSGNDFSDNAVYISDSAVAYNILKEGVLHEKNRAGSNEEQQDYLSNFYIEVDVKKNNGYVYSRSYCIPIDKLECLLPALKTEEYKAKNYPVECGSLLGTKPTLMSVGDANYAIYDSIPNEAGMEIYKAYCEEFMAVEDPMVWEDFISSASLEISYERNGVYMGSAVLEVPSSFTKTLALMEPYLGEKFYSMEQIDLEACHTVSELPDDFKLEDYKDSLIPGGSYRACYRPLHKYVMVGFYNYMDDYGFNYTMNLYLPKELLPEEYANIGMPNDIIYYK